jgi:hypothetical protein
MSELGQCRRKSLRKGPPKIENNRTIELDRFLGTSALHAHGKPKEAAMPLMRKIVTAAVIVGPWLRSRYRPLLTRRKSVPAEAAMGCRHA